MLSVVGDVVAQYPDVVLDVADYFPIAVLCLLLLMAVVTVVVGNGRCLRVSRTGARGNDAIAGCVGKEAAPMRDLIARIAQRDVPLQVACPIVERQRATCCRRSLG